MPKHVSEDTYNKTLEIKEGRLGTSDLRIVENLTNSFGHAFAIMHAPFWSNSHTRDHKAKTDATEVLS